MKKSQILYLKSQINPTNQDPKYFRFGVWGLGFYWKLEIKNRKFHQGGFSLMEMLVALGIFSATVVGILGVMLTVMNVQRKTAGVQAVIDDVRFGLELMSKELRTGTSYQLTDADGCAASNSAMTFISVSDGQKHIYYLNTSTGIIMRAVLSISPPQTLNPLEDCDGVPDANTTEAIPLTSGEVNITRLRFRLRGENYPDPTDGQPFVTISLGAESRDPKITPQTQMNIQTSVVQRIRDQ